MSLVHPNLKKLLCILRPPCIYGFSYGTICADITSKTQLEFCLHETQYSRLREHLLSLVPLPDAVVFLDATAAVCYARIHGLRKRGCESGIPLAYLAGLDECYQTFNKCVYSS